MLSYLFFIFNRLPSVLLSSGSTPESTAQILIHDRKFGFRALEKAKSYDDSIIVAIQAASNDFEDLDNRNAFWVADVLGARSSALSISTAAKLYASNVELQFLVGAIALAANNQLNDAFSPTSKVLKVLGSSSRSPEIELAIIALEKTKDVRAVPYLIKILKNTSYGYWVQARSCHALEEIGDSGSIVALEEALKEPSFHALPKAFKALVKLGSRNAVPLAISRVSPELEGTNAEDLIKELEKSTGKNFGFDRSAWETWWATEGSQ